MSVHPIDNAFNRLDGHNYRSRILALLSLDSSYIKPSKNITGIYHSFVSSSNRKKNHCIENKKLMSKHTYSSLAAPVVDENTAKVWALSANDILDDDVNIIDDDDLLDEEDLKKPDPASLRGDSCV